MAMAWYLMESDELLRDKASTTNVPKRAKIKEHVDTVDPKIPFDTT